MNAAARREQTKVTRRNPKQILDFAWRRPITGLNYDTTRRIYDSSPSRGTLNFKELQVDYNSPRNCKNKRVNKCCKSENFVFAKIILLNCNRGDEGDSL